MPKLVVSRVVQPPPGPMPTLMRVGAALEQEPRALGGGDVAGDRGRRSRKPLPDLGDRALHHQRVAVRDVDDEHVGAGTQHFGGALEIVAGRADGRADAQAALLVARRERMLAGA